ncbi:MAG: alpha/beta fold hydrolase [Gemmatimonadetes bacterium]|nr:alpha/beta fold hydrolase [Gemmatimonadota bacterium]
MPLLSVNGTRLHVEDAGGTGIPVVFSHGLLWSGRMFRAQVAALTAAGYRAITYDHRGQGSSADDAARSISIETVYEDAVALITQLGVAPCHFVGLSMGGFVGMRLAARRQELLRSLVLLETSADAEPAENVPKYRRLNWTWRWLGPGLVAKPVMQVMFGGPFLTDPARAAQRAEWEGQLRANRRTIWRAVNGVIERAPIAAELGRIRCPTTVMVGEEDRATVPAKAERIHAAIAGSRLVRIPRAGHSSSIEEPALVNAEILAHLDRAP